MPSARQLLVLRQKIYGASQDAAPRKNDPAVKQRLTDRPVHVFLFFRLGEKTLSPGGFYQNGGDVVSLSALFYRIHHIQSFLLHGQSAQKASVSKRLAKLLICYLVAKAVETERVDAFLPFRKIHGFKGASSQHCLEFILHDAGLDKLLFSSANTYIFGGSANCLTHV